MGTRTYSVDDTLSNNAAVVTSDDDADVIVSTISRVMFETPVLPYGPEWESTRRTIRETALEIRRGNDVSDLGRFLALNIYRTV